jgi:hypothetical protein
MSSGMATRRVLTDLLLGTILAAFAAGVSCLVALVGLRRPYYLAVLLPLCMLGYLLVAWLLYLRGDRFLGSPGAMRRPTGGPEAPARGGGGQTHGPPEALLRSAAARDGELVPRQDEDRGPAFPRANRALLCAAAELGITAALLYSLWGIGATYHG